MTMLRHGGARQSIWLPATLLLGAALLFHAPCVSAENRVRAEASAAVGEHASLRSRDAAIAFGEDEQPKSPAPRPRRAQKPEPPGPDAERYFRARFVEAQALYDEGNYRSAFRLADAILTVAPDLPIEQELRRFRRLAEGRYLSGSILQARFEFAEQEQFPRRAISGELFIENISAASIAVGIPDEACVIGQSRYQIRELYEDGSEWTNAGTAVVRAPAGRKLEAGQSWKIPVEIQFPAGKTPPVMQVFVVTGDLLPIEVRVANQNVTRGVPWVRTEIVALPPEHADKLDDPFLEMQMAILLGDARTLLIAGTVWVSELSRSDSAGRAEERRTIDLLIAALDSKDAIFLRVAMRLLQELTGLDHATVEAWKLWMLKKG